MSVFGRVIGDARVFNQTIQTFTDALTIFAEKVRTLLVRGMARDLYDLWFLMERSIEPDLELIYSKLSLYDKIYSHEEMSRRIAGLEKSWTKEFRPLLGVVVPYDVAAKRVVDGLSCAIKRRKSLS